MMLSFREMQRQVQAKMQNTSTSVSNDNDILPKIKDFINNRYQRIYRSHYWEESVDNYSFSMVASTEEYAFDRDFERVIGIQDTKNGKAIALDTIQGHIRNQSSSNAPAGDPRRCRMAGVYTVKLELSADDTVDIVSSSDNDISPNCVRIFGRTSSDGEIGENLALTGTTEATSQTTFTSGQKLQVSVGTTDSTRRTTVGVVTIKETTSGAVLARISPQEQAHKYYWFKVSPIPQASGTQATWNVWYQKQFKQLLNDNDIPVFDCCMEIVQGAFADALRDDGLEEEAAVAEQQFSTLVIELQATRTQPMLVDQFMPMHAPIDRFENNDSYLWVT